MWIVADACVWPSFGVTAHPTFSSEHLKASFLASEHPLRAVRCSLSRPWAKYGNWRDDVIGSNPNLGRNAWSKPIVQGSSVAAHPYVFSSVKRSAGWSLAIPEALGITGVQEPLFSNRHPSWRHG